MKKKGNFIGLMIVILGFALFSSIFMKDFFFSEKDILRDIEEIRETESPVLNEMISHSRIIGLYDSLISSGNIEMAFDLMDSLSRIKGRNQSSYEFRKGELLYELEKYYAKVSFKKSIHLYHRFDLRATRWLAYTFSKLGKCDSAKYILEQTKGQSKYYTNDLSDIKKNCNSELHN